MKSWLHLAVLLAYPAESMADLLMRDGYVWDRRLHPLAVTDVSAPQRKMSGYDGY